MKKFSEAKIPSPCKIFFENFTFIFLEEEVNDNIKIFDHWSKILQPWFSLRKIFENLFSKTFEQWEPVFKNSKFEIFEFF